MATARRSTARASRHQRVREKIRGTAARPRLAIYRSLTHIYAQLIDDTSGRTLAAASDLAIGRGAKGEGAALKRSERSTKAGEALAAKAKAAGVTEVVFDRGGNRYHGRVKALADAARKGGLQF